MMYGSGKDSCCRSDDTQEVGSVTDVADTRKTYIGPNGFNGFNVVKLLK